MAFLTNGTGILRHPEAIGWHHRLKGHESEETLGDSEVRGSRTCCSPWGCREPDMTEHMNNRGNEKQKKLNLTRGSHFI